MLGGCKVLRLAINEVVCSKYANRTVTSVTSSLGAILAVHGSRYATLCTLARADPTNDVEINGTVHPVDSVNVWPLLTGSNTTQPRSLTPVTETAVIQIDPDGTWWKLITLAGQSNYYSTEGVQTAGTDPCLAGAQPDPFEPGRTDPIVNGPGKGGKGCPVCNDTHPCLYSLLDDPSEKNNVAAANPTVVQRLRGPLEKSAVPYVSGHLSPAILAAHYTQFPQGHWGNFSGPCYARKSSVVSQQRT